MKKIYNYIMMFAMALVAVSCSDEEPVAPNPTDKSGQEVQFGLSLDPLSRTIYGTESNDAFPIYWSQGDLVTVASPQCAVTNAEYEVTPVAGQSYADALEKTGAAGVQWGSSAAYFYSIYPSANVKWQSLTNDNVTAKLNIGSVQSANIVLNGTTYNAADMNAVIMYAQTSEIQNGEVVNLQYNPYSTILEFEMTIGPSTENSNEVYGSAKVLSITLTAPENTKIAGDFTLKFNEDDVPTITAAGNNFNSIKMDFATQPMLTKDNSLKAKLAIIPDANITSIKDWKVTIEVVEGTNDAASTYTKTLDTESALTPGLIHKIKLPKLTPTAEWTYHTENWITSLYDYKNIYLTELSLPGAWYAGGKIYTNSNEVQMNYQATNEVTQLWEAGVRAFATECRTSCSVSTLSVNPSSVVVSGTQNNGVVGLDWFGKFCTGGTQIRSIIKNIAAAATTSVTYDENGNIKDGEFAVFVFSYADGGEFGHRDVDYAYFIKGVQNEIAQSGVANYIYANEITPNTTVADVIGKLIIKINVDDRLPNDSYDGSMNALISYNPLITQLGDNVDYSTPLFSKMYWGAWNDGYRTTTTVNANDFLWCFSSANRTQVNTGTNTTIPTYAQRQAALRGMMEHSREISANSGHNVWFYFNAGGTQTTSQEDENTNSTTFATTMNSWLLDLVKLKANGGTDTNGVFGTAGAYVKSDPSPLGIVMFNQCTNATYNGPAIIKEIIEMNNKFKLQRAAGTSNDGGGGNGELGEQ